MAEPDAADAGPGPNRWIRAGVGTAVVLVAFVWGLPAFADYASVWPVVTDLRTPAVFLLVVVGAANLVAPALNQVAALPGLTLRRAVIADWATTAVTNVVPGGSAMSIGLTWSMYRRWRLRHDAIARSIVVTGVWDVLTKLVTPLLAVAWLSGQRPVEGVLLRAAALGLALFVVALGLFAAVLSRPSVGARLGARLDRIPMLGNDWTRRLDQLRRDTRSLLRRRGLALTVSTVAGHLNLYLLLLVSVRATGLGGAEVSSAAVAAAFTFGRLVTAVPLTPGGLGVMEIGLAATLSTFAGPETDQAAIVAAVLVFRALSYLTPIVPGALILVWWSLTAQPDRDRVRSGPARS